VAVVREATGSSLSSRPASRLATNIGGAVDFTSEAALVSKIGQKYSHCFKYS